MEKEKGKMKSEKVWMSLLFTFSLLLFTSSAFACTGFYVGKKVSADGTTLIGRTVDLAPWNGPMREMRFERGERVHADGSRNKYAFICTCAVTSQQKGFYGGSGAINEMGVMLSATVTGRTNDEVEGRFDPFKPIDEGGYGEPNLPDLMIGNAATAREAVEILGEMIRVNGHSGPEIYMVADTNEAWYVEVYSGHEWAAVRMPEDQVAVFGNQFNICEFKTNDTQNVMYSPGLVSLAVENNFAKWKADEEGIIDLYATYSPSLWDYSNYRTFWGHNAWAPTDYPSNSYNTATHYELFFTPEKKIALTDVFELMRTRYEGVNCPEEKTNTSIRVIGTTKQQSCHVLQMRHDLPEAYRCTLWECLAQAEHSTFLPMCMAVKTIPGAYSRDQTGTLEYDPNRAADAFLRLDTLAELKRFVVDTYGVRRDVRPFYGDGVRAFWRAQEERLVAEWPTKLGEWSAGDQNAGSVAATAFVNFNQVWTLADAKRLHDELAWYWAEFNCDLRDGGGATDVPTYPFASAMPTNAEVGVSWTRWHRAEFGAYADGLVGKMESPSAFAEMLVDAAKHAFDGVQDEATLNLSKTKLLGVVEALCGEVENPKDTPLPVITFFKPDFTEGPTTEVPNVFWNISGPFDRTALTIDDEQVYEGDARCGDGRWRELSRPGIHRLKLTAGYGAEEVSASCFYTALNEGEEPEDLPRVIEFYSDFYTGFEGETPYVHWKVRDITTMEIWVDQDRVLVTIDEEDKFRLSQLRTRGSHIVRIVARNAIDDAESSFVYFTKERGKTVSSSAPLLQAAASAPVINAFYPDAYDASIWETPFIHWDLGGEVDLLQLTIDKIPVFIGDGNQGNGRWLDVSGLNVDEMNGSHVVTLSVSNSLGVVTSNFTCTCHWAEPPPPPPGSEGNPWAVGESVQAYTNGFGTLVIIGSGATSNFTETASLPWADVTGEIAEVEIPDTVTVIGDNLWEGLEEGTVINGETIVRRKAIATGFPDDSASAISPAEFERVDIIDGKAYLGVAVWTNSEVKASGEGWGVATNGVIEVPAPGKQGFFILKSKGK